METVFQNTDILRLIGGNLASSGYGDVVDIVKDARGLLVVAGGDERVGTSNAAIGDIMDGFWTTLTGKFELDGEEEDDPYNEGERSPRRRLIDIIAFTGREAQDAYWDYVELLAEGHGDYVERELRHTLLINHMNTEDCLLAFISPHRAWLQINFNLWDGRDFLVRSRQQIVNYLSQQ